MKYVVCFSGGHSSALCAIYCVSKFGKENVILLNHDILDEIYEHKDIKRFKNEVANYLGLTITYANSHYSSPYDVVSDIGCFVNIHNRQALCTYYLKTKPFYDWLDINCSHNKDDYVIVYGFDKQEVTRINRRVGVMALAGYKCYFPMLENDLSITDTEQIGVKKPVTYKIFKHANCIGCLKAGKQHWYLVYCLYPKIFEQFKKLEIEIGSSIIKDNFLRELEKIFYDMKYKKNICPNENDNSQSFWARVNLTLPEQIGMLPCDCAL